MPPIAASKTSVSAEPAASRRVHQTRERPFGLLLVIGSWRKIVVFNTWVFARNGSWKAYSVPRKAIAPADSHAIFSLPDFIGLD